MEKFGEAIAVALIGVVTIAAWGLLMSLPVYLLWNYCLVGAIDGVRSVTWLQAWGLYILCNFLFKSTAKA